MFKMMKCGRAAEEGDVACEHGLVEIGAVGFCNVGESEYLEVEPAVVNPTNLGFGEFVACNHQIHEVCIVEALEGKDAWGVDFNGALNFCEVVTKRVEPFDFDVWESRGDVGQERSACAEGILGPRDSYAEEGAWLASGAPVF